MNEEIKELAETIEKVTDWMLVAALLFFAALGFLLLPYVWR